MVTIKQIANLAGVSRGTVDRVLNERGGVSADTEAKVREIADAVGYTPNRVGKSLAMRKKNLSLAFIIFNSSASNPFFDDVITGILEQQEELNEYGITTDVYYTGFDDAQEQIDLLKKLIDEGVNGVAITPVNHPDVAKALRQYKEKDIPVITVNTDIDNSGRLAYVGSDYFRSGQTAAGLLGLIRSGKANIGIVTGSHNVLCHTERIEGFKEVIDSKYPGMKVVDIKENHDDDFESFSVTKTLLEENPEIDTLYLAAAGVYGAGRAVIELGMQEELCVISYDTVPTTRRLVEEGVIAATIDQQPVTQGSLSLELLGECLLLDKKPEKEFYYTEANIRIPENL